MGKHDQPGPPKIIDVAGKGIRSNQEQQDIRLEPGVIIVHCVLAPESGAVQIHRSERATPPKTNQEVRVEMDNWFSTLAYSIALLILMMEQHFGVPRNKPIQILLDTINSYLAAGTTRDKIVVNTTDDNTQAQKEIPSPIKINYDADLTALGFEKINDITYTEYCTKKGLADRDKSKTPIAPEFNDFIVFRKKLNTGEGAADAKEFFLEVARVKDFIPHALDKKVSKYLVAMVCANPDYTGKHYWNITNVEQTVELLQKIEAEATHIAKL